MATVNFRRFNQAGVLKQVHPRHLRRLLATEAKYFSDRGINIGDVDGNGMDYKALVNVLADSDSGMPEDLVDALYYIHEMSSVEDMDELLDDNASRPASEQVQFDFRDDPTPIDVAIQVWLYDRTRLEDQHAQKQLTSRRVFECYLAKKRKPFTMPDAATITAMQDALDDWFADHRRGRNCRVFP